MTHLAVHHDPPCCTPERRTGHSVPSLFPKSNSKNLFVNFSDGMQYTYKNIKKDATKSVEDVITAKKLYKIFFFQTFNLRMSCLNLG
jgi:hypothetical protein